MNLKFYEVDGEYIKYLRVNGDQKIPNIEYEKHKKFFCGIVLTINNFNYFAPVSSYNKKVHTSFLIMDKDRETKELKAIYRLGLNEKNRQNFNICDFKKLEEKCLEYIKFKNV